LIELMVTVALIAIVAAAAIPSFTTMIQNNRLTAQTNDLVANLNYARSEAADKGNMITICASADQANCGGPWNAGWIIFIDVNGNGGFDGGADTLLRVHEGFDGTNTLDGSAAVANAVTYTNTGFTNLAAGATFAVCDDRGNNHGREIALSPTGRLSATPAPASCTP